MMYLTLLLCLNSQTVCVDEFATAVWRTKMTAGECREKAESLATKLENVTAPKNSRYKIYCRKLDPTA